MLKKVLFSGVGFLCLTNVSFADSQYPFYVQVSTGASFSMEAKLTNIDFTIWDPANQGYRSRLGNTPIFGLGAGYNINSWSSLLLSWDWRGIYNYQKYQTQVIGSNPLDSLGEKTRYFDLKNNNLMLTFTANSSQLNNLHIDFNDSVLAPFIGIGVGVAKNDLTNFYSITPSTGGIHRNHIDGETTYSLASQGIVGLSLSLTKQAGIDLGYRFYYGGRFKTGNFIMDDGITSDCSTPPWKGNLFANEVFLNLKYNL